MASHLIGPWHVICVQEGSAFCDNVTLQGNYFTLWSTSTAAQSSSTRTPSSQLLVCPAHHPSQAHVRFLGRRERDWQVPQGPQQVGPLPQSPTFTTTTSAPSGDPSVLPCSSWCATCVSSAARWCSPVPSTRVPSVNLLAGSDNQRRISPARSSLQLGARSLAHLGGEEEG